MTCRERSGGCFKERVRLAGLANDGLPLVGYIRVGTAEQADSGASIEAQRQIIETAAARAGRPLLTVPEETARGKTVRDRPKLRRASRLIERGQADGIVAAKLDRLSRSVLDFALFPHQATAGGWTVTVCDRALDASTPEGEAMAYVLMAWAQFERRRIVQRTREALAVPPRPGRSPRPPVRPACSGARPHRPGASRRARVVSHRPAPDVRGGGHGTRRRALAAGHGPLHHPRGGPRPSPPARRCPVAIARRAHRLSGSTCVDDPGRGGPAPRYRSCMWPSPAATGGRRHAATGRAGDHTHARRAARFGKGFVTSTGWPGARQPVTPLTSLAVPPRPTGRTSMMARVAVGRGAIGGQPPP